VPGAIRTAEPRSPSHHAERWSLTKLAQNLSPIRRFFCKSEFEAQRALPTCRTLTIVIIGKVSRRGSMLFEEDFDDQEKSAAPLG
jgi:hypothetical protein